MSSDRVACACACALCVLFVCMQLEATGKENTEIQEAQALQISEMEERLKVANEDKEHLKAEGRKMKAHSKVLTAALCMQVRCFWGRGGVCPRARV